jgi:hypothetical protein
VKDESAGVVVVSELEGKLYRRIGNGFERLDPDDLVVDLVNTTLFSEPEARLLVLYGWFDVEEDGERPPGMVGRRPRRRAANRLPATLAGGSDRERPVPAVTRTRAGPRSNGMGVVRGVSHGGIGVVSHEGKAATCQRGVRRGFTADRSRLGSRYGQSNGQTLGERAPTRPVGESSSDRQSLRVEPSE